MRCYRDIWISKSSEGPKENLRGPEPWLNEEAGFLSIWMAGPPSGGPEWFSQEVPGGKMYVLGDFYETVDGKALASGCRDYARGKAKDFRDPAGHYLLIWMDEERHEISVFTQRHGSLHVYYETGSSPAISTQYMSLARASAKQLDWRSILGFLSLGYFSADQTHLESVRIMQPARCYRFDRQLRLLEVRRYWDWYYDPQHRSRQEALEQFDHTMKEVLLGSCARRKVVLPLSGGLDSRTLAGLLRNGTGDDTPIRAYSYGYYRRSPEIQIGRALAKKAGYPFQAYVIGDYVWEHMDRIMRSTEGFQSVDGTRQVSIHEELAAAGEAVLCGHWGDVWMDTMQIDAYDSLEQAWDKKLIKRGAEWFWAHGPQGTAWNPRKDIEDYFQEFRQKYQYLDHEDLVMQVYKTEEWSFRWTLASLRTYQEGIWPLLPFYDRRVGDLFLTIPKEWQKSRAFQIDYLKKFHPDLAGVVWQEYGRDLYHYKGWNNRNLLYRILARLGRLGQKNAWVQRNWELTYLSAEGRSRLGSVLQNEKLSPYFSPKVIGGLLDEFYRRPTAARGYTVSMLHTLAQFLNRLYP